MSVKDKVKGIFGWLQAKRFGVTAEQGVYIGKSCSLKGKKADLFRECSNNPSLCPNLVGGGTVRIGQGSEIGERCRISIANSLNIGKKVLLSPNVYITDCDHEYRNLKVPVIDQGIVQKGQIVTIGDGSYIGINAVIVGNVKIGKHCVIGANSVVTKDVPDYCVAVGSPAKVIKKISVVRIK